MAYLLYTNMGSKFRQVLFKKIAQKSGTLTNFIQENLNKSGNFKSLFLNTPPGPAREKLIYETAIKLGPPKNLVPITIDLPNGIKITYQVMPDYFMIDGLRVTMAPATAQKIANYFHMYLPTDKMSKQIYQAADTKIRATPLSSSGYRGNDGKFYNPEEVIKHRINQSDAAIFYNNLTNQKINELQSSGKSPILIAGHGKDILQPSNPTDPRIGGWAGETGNVLQPYSTAHKGQALGHSEYGLYTRLIGNDAQVIFPDGKVAKTTLDKLLSNPIISKALTNQNGVTSYEISDNI